MPVQLTVHPAHRASGNTAALSDARLLSAVATLRDALAPDMALNLPAVLDRSALLDALSVLSTNATASAPVLACVNPGNPACQCRACESVDGDLTYEVFCRVNGRMVQR